MLGRISRGVKNLGNILEWLLDELLLSLKAIHFERAAASSLGSLGKEM